MLLHQLITHFAAASCTKPFLGLPSWHEYLQHDAQCQISDFSVPDDLVLVALAVVDILLRVAGIVAVLFVIIGGIQYVTSQGNPDEATKARNTIINALLGLALAMIAVGAVSFIGRRLGA